MGLKSVRREELNEGPMDFMRGAAGEMGSKMGQAARSAGAAIKSTAGDIANAGREASAMGNFTQLVVQLGQAIAKYDQLKQKLGASQQGQEEPAPEEQAPVGQQEQPTQQPAAPTPQAPRRGLTPNSRRAPTPAGKPQYTFSSYMQATHGEQLDEGVWDFVKGAGGAVAKKVGDKINQYAGSAGNTFRDIYHAGAKASAAGNLQKMQQEFAQTETQTKELLKQVLAQLKQFGQGKAQQAFKAASAKLPQELFMRVYKLVSKNSNGLLQ